MQNPYSIAGMQPAHYGEVGDWYSERRVAQGEITYPEIYYKIQPFILSACDAMLFGSGGNVAPTWNQVDAMSEEIYADISAMHPDLLEYAGVGMTASYVETAQFGGGRFRRRGVFRDVLDILLLNELFRRGGFLF